MSYVAISGGPEHHANQELEKNKAKKREKKTIEWARQDFISVDEVSIDKWGVIVDTANKSRKELIKMRLGSNVRLKFKAPVADGSKIKADRIVTLTHEDMGKRPSKTQAAKIRRYIDNKSDAVSIQTGKGVTTRGILCIFFGIISLVLSCLFGVWSDPEKKRGVKKKA